MSKPQFLIDLEENGYTVVKGVVPKEHCKEFQESALNWLEGFPYGFKRDDRSTWDNEHLPYSFKAGLYNRYAVNHEEFVWKIRTEPAIIDTFSKIWGTDDLIGSFDGLNIALPVNEKHGRTDIKPTQAWPHIDQNPRRIHLFELYQGIANLSENGPDDGGLVLLRGSQKLHEEFFKETGGWKKEQDSGADQNGYGYIKEDVEWYRNKGCEEVKVCAGEGDLILWDSRTIHWNASPVGERTRFVTYVCYCPRSLMTQEQLDKKLEVFRAHKGTTHWPQMNVIPVEKHDALPKRPDGSVDNADRSVPLHPVKETEAIMRVVGVRA